MLKYIELKSGFNDDGPAWIGRVSLSKSGRTIYFNGLALKTLRGKGISANYADFESGEEYWVSSPKRNGADRHWAGKGKVMVERAALAEYLEYRELGSLDPRHFQIVDDVVVPDLERLHAQENA